MKSQIRIDWRWMAQIISCIWNMTMLWHFNHFCTEANERHGPLARYVKLRVAHAPGMPGTFSPAADFKENRLLAIPACITARAWRTCRDACRDRLHAVTGKTFPAFPAHAHPQFYVSGKRHGGACICISVLSELSHHGFSLRPVTSSLPSHNQNHCQLDMHETAFRKLISKYKNFVL